MDTPWPEVAARFGPQGRLLGVLNHRPRDTAVAALLINVGVTHRVGPRRINVKMARSLAAAGISSFRFDLSGIGDSGAASADDGYRERAVSDLSAAMDEVEATTGIRQFAVLGICSGAVNGFRAAKVDRRIVALMMFDGYAHASLLTHLVHDLTRMRTTPLRRFGAKLVNRARRSLGLPATPSNVSIFYASGDADSPDREAFGDVLDALDARGVSLLVVYSGSLLGQYNHASQFRRVFDGRAFLRRVDDRFLPHIDHIVTTQAAQAEFVALVTNWTSRIAGESRSLVLDEPRRVGASA